jgi:putative protease
MKKHIELLAPGGDIDSIKAAILAGANAIYCGLDKFNARNRATNIIFNDLSGILRLAHSYNCQVFLTLNIIVVDSELPAIVVLLNKLVNTSIDGIIVQDLGLFYLISKYFKGLKIHASTQLTTHNEGQIKFLAALNATRVNLSRELNIQEIKTLTQVAHENNVLTEVFVHGSYCICFSGICYMSSVHGGNSGNRGRCSQPCRDQYIETPAGKSFPLNLKDNSAFTDLITLADAGVDSLKIEGRIKKYHYVYTVVQAWRKQLDQLNRENTISNDRSDLYKVFNRDFSNGFLKGEIGKHMFIDNPRDNSAIHLSLKEGNFSDESLEVAKGAVFEERTGIISAIENQIKHLSVAKLPVKIAITADLGAPLKVSIETPERIFQILSECNVSNAGSDVLGYEMLLNRFKSINETEYFIEELKLNIQPNVFIPFKELTAIKKRLLFILNNEREYIDPIDVPSLQKQNPVDQIIPELLVLIDTIDDLRLYNKTSATICFRLPNNIHNSLSELVEIFINNHHLIPWFPAVIIGGDYSASIDFLAKVKPNRIITNNSGIAFEAYKRNISWIAGPQMNIVNSYSLKCLKENFNCTGAFISNEISKVQLKGLRNPDDFKLFYSIYHPIVLMTSRLCLFHQVTSCEKAQMDDSCLGQCEKFATITNLKGETFFIEKSKGNYHNIYNESNLLNTAIVSDFPNVFSGFQIDLCQNKTKTHVNTDKLSLIGHFNNLLHFENNATEEFASIIVNTNNIQYKKGI